MSQVRRILLIHDDAEESNRLARMLRSKKGGAFSVHRSVGGEDAVTKLGNEEFDLVLHRVDQADPDDFKHLQAIRKHYHDLPVVVICSAGNTSFASRILRAGAQDCLFEDELTDALLSRAVSYAIDRASFTRKLQDARKTLRRKNRDLAETVQEEQHRWDLLGAGPVVLCSRDAEGSQQIRYVSENVQRFGLSAASLVDAGTSYIDLIHEDDREYVLAQLAAAASAGHDQCTMEYRLVTVSDREIRVQDTTLLRTEDTGTGSTYQAYLLDVSDQHIAERERRRTEDRYQTLIESINDVVFEIGADGAFRFMSHVGEAHMGYNVADVVGKSFVDFVHPDDVDIARAGFESAIRGDGGPHKFRVLNSRDEERLICVSSRPRFENGELVSIVGLMSDVSQNRMLEQEIADVRMLSQGYLDVADIMLLALDSAGAITMINRKGEQILGYAAGELLGRNWFDTCIPEELRNEIRTLFQLLIQGDSLISEAYENVVLTKSGDQRSIHWRNSILRADDGTVTGVLSSGEDVTDRRRIEAEALRSRERLELALWGADLGAWDLDVVTDTVVFNPRALELLGYAAEEIGSYSSFRARILPPEDAERLTVLMEEHFQGRTPFYQAESWFITASGDWKWLLERGKVVEYDEDGNPQRMAGTILDLTDRKHAEIAMTDSEQRFRLLAEQSTDIIWLATAELDLIFVSPSVEHILGYSAEEALGLSFADLLRAEEVDRVREAVVAGSDPRVRAAIDAPIQLEVELKCKDGSWLWVEVVATVIYGRDGKPVRIQGNTRDISKRRFALQALADSEEKYRLLVENQTDLVVKVDTEGRLLFVSPSYCRMFGKSEEELLGHAFMPLVHAEDHEKVRQALKALDQPPHSTYVEERALTHDGWRWMAWSNTAILGEKGEIREIVGVGRDITSQKQAELASIESERRLRSVVTNLPVVLFTLDPDGLFTLSEGKGLETLGLLPGEVVGSSVYDVYKEHPQLLDAIRRALKGESFSEVVTVDTLQFETWFNPLLSDAGAVRAVVGVSVNITERLETERELDRHRNHLEELVEARTLELERANERLRRFRFALDSAADSIFIIDPGTLKFLDSNSAAYTTLGYSREELLTMGPEDIAPAYSREQILRDINAVLSGQTEVGVVETTYQRSDGEQIPVEMFLRSFAAQEETLIISTVRDISRRKIAEASIRQSEAKYRIVLENANEAIFVAQGEKFRFFNYKVVELAGLPVNELLDASMYHFVHPEDQPTLKARYQARLEGRELQESYEMRVFDSNGTIRWMEGRDAMIDWEGKRATLNLLNDITARKQAEDFIKFQASLLNIVRNSVIALDLSERVVFWNSWAQELYGWASEEVLGRKVSELYVFNEEFDQRVLKHVRASGSWEGEVTRTRRDGSSFPAYVIWNAIELGGDVTGYVGIGIDMTERKKLERDLLQSQKLASLGILSEGIAHELRNPLGYASSAAQLLLNKKNLSEESREKYSKAIYTGVQRANKIVENLLLVGKPKGQLMKHKINLIEALREAKSQLSSHAIFEQITVHEDFAEDPMLMHGNLEMLVQLFYNLFVNALNEMPEGGELFVKAKRGTKSVEVRVADTGPGIPQDIVNNIFDPFFTASGSGKGVGLGLTLCYFIMEDHDGRIEVEQEEDRGAVFVLTFPDE